VPIVVAMAAPVTPSFGNGPTPKIRQAEQNVYSICQQSTRIAIAASPAPRKMRLSGKASRYEIAAEHDASVIRATGDNTRRPSKQCEKLGANKTPEMPEQEPLPVDQ